MNDYQRTVPSQSEDSSAVSAPLERTPRSSSHPKKYINEEDDGLLPFEQGSSEPQRRDSRLPTDTGRTPTVLEALFPVMHSLHHTHDNVMHQTLNLNDARAPLTTSLMTFMPSLDKLMTDLSSFFKSPDVLNGLSEDFHRLENDFTNIRDGHYQEFRSANDKYEQQETPLVQALWRSSRYFDNVLGSHNNDSAMESLWRTVSSSHGVDDVLLEEAHSSPALLQFFSKTDHVDAVREKLFDLHFEHEQILSDKTSREQLGLSLDEDSLALLESFELLNRTLLEELQAAEATLDSCRRGLTEEELHTISAIEHLHSPSDDEITLQDLSLLDIELQRHPRTDESESACSQLQREPLPIWSYLDPLKPIAIDPTDFINAWMLNELQSSARQWKTYMSTLQMIAGGLDAERLDLLINDTWFNDIPSSELAQRRKFADQQSMEQNEAASQYNVPRSATMVIAAPSSVTLLKLSSAVTANEIMERACQARSSNKYCSE